MHVIRLSVQFLQQLQLFSFICEMRSQLASHQTALFAFYYLPSFDFESKKSTDAANKTSAFRISNQRYESEAIANQKAVCVRLERVVRDNLIHLFRIRTCQPKLRFPNPYLAFHSNLPFVILFSKPLSVLLSLSCPRHQKFLCTFQMLVFLFLKKTNKKLIKIFDFPLRIPASFCNRSHLSTADLIFGRFSLFVFFLLTITIIMIYFNDEDFNFW